MADSLLLRLDALDRRVSDRMLVRSPDGDGQPAWVRVLRRFSQAGSYGVGWVVLFGVVVTAMEGVVAAIVAAACVLGTLACNTLVKQFVRRPRPQVNAVGHQPSTHSMPSAHTSMAVVGASVMCVVAPAFAPLWIAVAVALGVSRVMLGMHYLGDVLAGALFGLLLAGVAAVPLMQHVT